MLNSETGTTFQKNGKCTVTEVAVSDQDFTSAIKVVVGTDVSNAWDAQLKFPAVGGVAINDVVLVAFWARCTASLEETGEGALNVIIEHNVSYAKELSTNVHVGGEWKEYYTPSKIASALSQSEISLLFHMGFPSQTVEVANVRFLNYQDKLNLEDLPETEMTYVGQAPDASWRAPAEERIGQIRKGGASIRVYDESGAPLEGAQIRIEMDKHQFGFGTAIAASEFNSNATYRNMIFDHFNEVVFENDLKWPQFINASTHPGITRVLDSLDAHGIPARGHNIIWPSFRHTPQVVEDLKDNPEALRAVIDKHIDEVVGFAEGRLNDWDVINEPYSEHDIQDILGDEVMADWFRRTRRLDRGVKLYLNDYSILSGGGNNKVKQDYYYGLVQDIEAWGGEIDGIGMQGHFGTDLTSITKVYEILERFAELDKEIKITEFDINTTQRGVQADYTRDFMTILFSHPSVKSLMVWGFWANRHWKPESAFYEGDWSIRPHGEVWNDLIKNQWWTPATDLVSDANGDMSIEGFLGDYSYTLSYGDVVRTGTFSLDNSFQSGHENSIFISLDESLPESVEITSSHPGYICSGDLVRLQTHEADGLAYLWEKDGVELEQQESSIVVGDSGIYTVTISNNGLSLSSAPYVLELRESPASEMLVEGELEICQGATVTFSVDDGGLSEYEWYRNNYRTQWGNTQLSASTTGSYQVEVISNGCASLSDPQELVVHSLPDAAVEMVGESTFCEGGSVVLNASTQAGVIFTWYRGEELLEETGSSLTVTESGSYSLVASNENCSNSSSSVEVEVLSATDPQCTVGMDEELYGTRVFPNPFHGVLQVEFPAVAVEKSTIEVFDALGNLVVLKQAEAGVSLLMLTIETPGLYTLCIIRGEDIQIHKVIKL